MTPAPVADAGYLDGLDLTSETFTVVGYGTDEFVTGSVGSPKAITVYDGARSYRDVSVITTQDLFPDRFVKITKSVCFGDSGGPMFHEGTLVALNTWTFSYRCDGPNLQYRVDSEPAQDVPATPTCSSGPPADDNAGRMGQVACRVRSRNGAASVPCQRRRRTRKCPRGFGPPGVLLAARVGTLVDTVSTSRGRCRGTVWKVSQPLRTVPLTHRRNERPAPSPGAGHRCVAGQALS